MACIADRENGRILCYSYPDGEFQFQIFSNEFHGLLFSIAYSPINGGVLYAVSGAHGTAPKGEHVKAFLFNVTTQSMIGTFVPSAEQVRVAEFLISFGSYSVMLL